MSLVEFQFVYKTSSSGRHFWWDSAEILWNGSKFKGTDLKLMGQPPKWRDIFKSNGTACKLTGPNATSIPKQINIGSLSGFGINQTQAAKHKCNRSDSATIMESF